MGQTDAQLFTSNTSGTQPYRIPAIVQTGKNDILVFSDKRYDGGDIGQNGSNKSHIDLVYRRWNGTSWEDEKLIADGNSSFGYGDAAVVADREDPNNILLMCAAGNTFFTKGQVKCYRFRSSDGGANWTNEGDVTSAVYSAIGNPNSAFFSSGRICQSSQIKVGNHYRLYAALCVTGTNSVVVYSDDFGENWHQLGSGVAVSGGDEAKCEELPNGDVLVSSRKENDRYFNVFTYTEKTSAAGSWEEKVEGNLDANKNSGQATNGEILIVPAVNANGAPCYLALQSMPYGQKVSFWEDGNKKRAYVSIYYKELSVDASTSYASSDFSSGWTRYQVSSTTSAYSSMIWQADGNIGFVWEDDYKSWSKGLYNIEYRNLPISTITGGAYTNVRSWKMSQVSCDREWCSNSSFSTLYLPYGVQLPEGVTAYTGTIEGDVLTINPIEGGVVPERTAVLLEDVQARQPIELTMVNTSLRIEENDLEGVLVSTPFDDANDYYVLGHGTNHIGFYHPSGTALKANAAYIPASKVNGANALQIRFAGEDATDIDNEEWTMDDEPVIYDLMGRRVTEMQPGRIYIVNGKKRLAD